MGEQKGGTEWGNRRGGSQPLLGMWVDAPESLPSNMHEKKVCSYTAVNKLESHIIV